MASRLSLQLPKAYVLRLDEFRLSMESTPNGTMSNPVKESLTGAYNNMVKSLAEFGMVTTDTDSARGDSLDHRPRWFTSRVTREAVELDEAGEAGGAVEVGDAALNKR
ncbi:hypothetical protein E4U37_005557 [Claviceps purpurea]|nr:hypothetical protein E4U37_005557 [Claviceps purpurea]